MGFFTHRSSPHTSSLDLAFRTSLVERNLAQEYRAIQALFTAQPSQVQFSINNQAQALGEALIHQRHFPEFSLPHWVVCKVGAGQPKPLPASFIWQRLDGWKDRINHAPLLEVLERRLSDLERGDHPAVAAAAALLRFATARHLVQGLLPPADSISFDRGRPALTVETGDQDQTGPVDRRLVPVQPFVEIFRAAFYLAAYITVDEEYRLKKNCLLVEWLSQCRDLAVYETDLLIQDLRRRAEASELNRGLRLSVPYFDDQRLEMRLYDFPVIPAGRIPFDPYLLLAAVRAEQPKVGEDSRLSLTTRLHLIAELRNIERAFQDRPKQFQK